MKYALTVLTVSALLAGCANDGERVAFDGQYFKTKVAEVDDDQAQFQISVSPVSASLDGAREAGRHQATKYCIENFGLSDATWVAGPDAEATDLILDGDTLLLRGACDG